MLSRSRRSKRTGVTFNTPISSYKAHETSSSGRAGGAFFESDQGLGVAEGRGVLLGTGVRVGTGVSVSVGVLVGVRVKVGLGVSVGVGGFPLTLK